MKTRLIIPPVKILQGLLFFIFLTLFIDLQAQPPLRARPLNVFTSPGQPVTIDVAVKSELGNCNASTIDVTIPVSPLSVNGAAVNGDKQIVYTPAPGFTGQDSLRYQIDCSGTTSSAVVLINVGNKPQVIMDDACAVPPAGINWAVTEENSIGTLATSAPFVVGDLDKDGYPDIAGLARDEAPGGYTGIRIFWGNASHTFTTTDYSESALVVSAPVMARIRTDSGEKPVIFFLKTDSTINALEAGRTNPQPLWSASLDSVMRGGIGIADFNNDGWTEVYIGNRVYDAATGALLCDGEAGNNSGYSRLITTGQHFSCAADIMGDSGLELVAGNVIYEVEIDRAASTKTLQVISSVATPEAACPDDGVTVVADFDNDGKLDVLVRKRHINAGGIGDYYLYIWTPHTGTSTGQLLAWTKDTHAYAGIPFVGDIDGDGNVEIVTLGSNGAYQLQNGFRARKYVPNPDPSRAFDLFWDAGHWDQSGGTGMTLFDFNQDGKSEIVYRDENCLRILDGSQRGRVDTLSVFTSYSETGLEYPVVVDIYNNGKSAILVTCDTGGPRGSGNGNSYGYTGVANVKFFSDASWAPARPVWNRYSYNPVYVNDDLTIPKNPLNPATFFVDKDGRRHQPFNNFLQQATLLNDEGKMLAYGPNFEFEPNSVEIIQNGAIVDVRFNILNTGDADYTGDVTISSHAFENGLFRKLDSRPVTVAALRGTPAAVSYTITNFPASLVAANALQVRINEDDGAFPIPECTYSGNYSRELFGAPNYAFCGGEEATLFFYPQNSPHTYYWYNENPKDNPGAVSFRQGASHSFTKDATQAVERFFVRIYDDAGRDWLNDEVYPVSAFLVPDSLVWTGAVDSDWNDPDNWNYPNAPSSTCPECQAYRIPGSCTGVEIPGGKSRYPVLTSQDSPATVYAGYSCDRIRFGFGGEVKRTDSLQYREAFVDLTLKGNRWYLFSPPLRNFYTGDFYVSTPNSYVDGYFIEPMFFEANNPQTGTRTASATWTGRFNTPDIEAGVGSGMAVWVDKANTGYDNHDPVTFRFPKSDPFYYYYTDYGQQLDEHTPALDRTNGKRFVYEPNISAGGIVTWSIPDATNGQSYLIGNPFMAHLNFEAFADSNDTQILPQYKLAYGVASSAANGKVRGFVTRIKDGGGYVNTEPYEDGSVALTSHIAPMQAFVVTSRVDGTLSLRAFMTDTEVNLAEPFSLRGAGDNLPERLLRISAFGEGHAGHALVLHRENGSHDYVPEEDSYSLFAGNDSVSVAVYTRSSDGYALDVNTIGRLDRGVSIGIRTVRRGEIRLKFTGTESFGSGVLVYLHDMLAGTVVCLSEGYEHVFGKTDGELYLDNRFFLTFSEVTDIRETPSEPDITVGQLPDGRVQVVSEGGRALGRVQVTGLQGNVILSQEHVESSCTFRAPAPGVYIVRVGTKVKKLVVSD